MTTPTLIQSGVDDEAATPHGLHEWGGHTKDGIEWAVHRGDALQTLQKLPANHFNSVITSPPYFWQRDYKVLGQYGLERTVDAYVENLFKTMKEVRRVLRKDGTLFLNLGDTYYSAKGQPKGSDKKNSARRFGLRAVDQSGLGFTRKTALGLPWRVALKMIGEGWILRAPIVWHRPKSPPEPTAKDRPWRTYETVFLFAKQPRYHFARKALAPEEDLWTISERPVSAKGIHSAAFPDALVKKCLDVGCPPKGRVLDPFAGSGTVLRVALQTGRPSTGIDLSERYCQHIVRTLRPL